MTIIELLIVTFMAVPIPGNLPFTAEWNPVATTVNYRIMLDGEQIGADFPKEFGSKFRWQIEPPILGLHSFAVYSVDIIGVATLLPVKIDGKGSGLIAPTQPKLVKE